MLKEMLIPECFKELQSTEYRYKLYYGGRGGGKSHSIARQALILSTQKKIRILCTREIQNSIKDSVHKLLADLIKEYALPGFKITDHSIEYINGSEFLFKGLRGGGSTSGFQAIKSTEAIDICWVEEAQTISEESLDILIPTIRQENSQIWFSFNRFSKNDPVWNIFCRIPDHKILVKKVNYYDNPFLPQVLLDEAKRCQELEPEKYQHVWLGEPKINKEGAVYKFNSRYHTSRNLKEHILKELPDQKILRVWDFGLYPAILFCAITPYGLRLLYELVPDNRPTLSQVITTVSHICNTEFAGRYFEDICDVAGNQTNRQTGKTDIEILRANGINPLSEQVPIEDGIVQVQNLLDRAEGLLIDSRCESTIEAFEGGYYRKEDKTGLGKEMPPEEKHPYEDVMDCVRYAVWRYYKPESAHQQKERSMWDKKAAMTYERF